MYVCMYVSIYVYEQCMCVCKVCAYIRVVVYLEYVYITMFVESQQTDHAKIYISPELQGLFSSG